MSSSAIDVAFGEALRLHGAGDLPKAERAYRAVLGLLPTYGPALVNLGALLGKTGREDEAEQCYHLALAGDPNLADAHYNLGNLQRRRQQWQEAIASYRACVERDAKHANAWFNLGVASMAQGRLADAVEAFANASALEPTPSETDLRLGDAQLRLGRAQEAVASFQRYADAFPNEPRGLYNSALALANCGRPADAQGLLHRVLKLKPDYAEAHNALGLTLELLGRKDDALHHYDLAVQYKPELADAWSNKGVNLVEQGRSEEAILSLRESLRVRPMAPAIHSNLLLMLNYSSHLTAEQVRAEHEAWAAKFAVPVEPRPAPHPPHDPERRLRLGYVSADFRDHTVSGFIELLLRHHDRSRFEIFAYPASTKYDARSEELRSLADQWQPLTGLSERDSADRIEFDRIDILVDLGGHTANNRLIAFAYRPACVQATLFGYPNTTAVAAMDYRVTDAISDPPGSETLYTESCLRLPDAAWCYLPPKEAPPVSPLPGLARKQFTFGSLNNSAKMSDSCVDLWCRLLRESPGSRLVLMAGQSSVGLKRLADRFVKAGILRDRVQLLNRLPKDRYFEAYAEFDIALDPFPYNGGVTTCDALYMGVPVLTLPGANYAARQGAMQMSLVNLKEFIAASPDDFVAKAKGWMGRRAELGELRTSLRDRLLASPLCDAPRYVRNLEAALRAEWQKQLPKG